MLHIIQQKFSTRIIAIILMAFLFFLSTNIFAQSSNESIDGQGRGRYSKSVVPVVCLAQDYNSFASAQGLSFFKNLLDVLNIIVEDKNSSLLRKKVADEINNKFPPVGTARFLPAGTGFVVQKTYRWVNEDKKVDPIPTDKNAIEVAMDRNELVEIIDIATNMHVALQCTLAGDKNGEIGLGVLIPSNNDISVISGKLLASNRAKNSFPYKTICKEKGYKKQCEGFYSDAGGREIRRIDAEELDNNLIAPDLAIIRLEANRRTSGLIPLKISNEYKIESKGDFEIVGYPYTSVIPAVADKINRFDIATPDVVTARYSSIKTFSNGQVVMGEDPVSINLYRLEATVHEGNSGSPVIKDNEVIGVVTLKATENNGSSAGYAYALPSTDLVRLLKYFEIDYSETKKVAENIKPQPKSVLTPPKPIENWYENKTVRLVAAGGILTLLVIFGLAFVVSARNKQSHAIDGNEKPKDNVDDPDIETKIFNGQETTGTYKPEIQAKFKLRVLYGENAGGYQLPTVTNGQNSIKAGRDPNTCQMKFPDENTIISRVHCIFTYNAQEQQLLVLDLSTNGVYVNGSKVLPKTNIVLNVGDRVELGAVGKNTIIVEGV